MHARIHTLILHLPLECMHDIYIHTCIHTYLLPTVRNLGPACPEGDSHDCSCVPEDLADWLDEYPRLGVVQAVSLNQESPNRSVPFGPSWGER